MNTPFQDLQAEDFEDEELTEMKSNSFFGSSSYLKYTARDKMKYLWAQVKSSNGKAGSFPWTIAMPKIFT